MTSQVLKAFHACVSEKLSKASSSCPALNSLCEQVQSSMNSLLSPKNHELLSDSLSARDLAFSLGRIYIGMLSNYPSLLLLLFLHHLYDLSVYTTSKPTMELTLTHLSLGYRFSRALCSLRKWGSVYSVTISMKALRFLIYTLWECFFTIPNFSVWR